jgi:hypothetical protein
MAARKAPAKRAATKHIARPTGPARLPESTKPAPMQKAATRPTPAHPAKGGR